MGRPKKKPDYDPKTVMYELLQSVAECYQLAGGNGSTGALSSVAEEFEFTHLKARKLLITAGTYSSDICDEVQYLRKTGKTIPEIMVITGLGRASVHSYLPYTKIAYNVKELSSNAERIRKFRIRQEAVRLVQSCIEDDIENLEKYVWKAMKPFEDYLFRTEKGAKFRFTVFGNDLYVNKDEAIINMTTVDEAVCNAIKLGRQVGSSKQLDVSHAEFLYPILKRLGIVS